MSRTKVINKTKDMTFKSIVPSEMTQQELDHLIGDLSAAQSCTLPTLIIRLDNGMDYKIDVKDIDDYIEYRVKYISTT